MTDSRILLTVGLLLSTLLASPQATASDVAPRVEIFTGSSAIHWSDDWTGFIPLPRDAFPPTDDHSSGFGLRDITVGLDVGRGFELVGTWQPELEAAWAGTYRLDPEGTTTREGSGSTAVEAFDLALGRSVVLGRGWRLGPRLGLTHLTRQDRLSRLDVDTGSYNDPVVTGYRADGRWSLWGVVAGLEAGWRPHPRLELVADVAVRFASGSLTIDDEDTFRSGPDPGGYSEVRSERRSVRESTGMVSGRIGVRVDVVADRVAVEAGWYLRDWSADAGPGRFEGAYAGVVARF